ncbi:MAG TPA: hypothetical protein DCP31_36115 [Cyanobacteria bacterium UBA8543]|nr:hypothetical protein [Cyanobacteria bacterium UBA8543]
MLSLAFEVARCAVVTELEYLRQVKDSLRDRVGNIGCKLDLYGIPCVPIGAATRNRLFTLEVPPTGVQPHKFKWLVLFRLGRSSHYH